jgi:hypothetical protein
MVKYWIYREDGTKVHSREVKNREEIANFGSQFKLKGW